MYIIFPLYPYSHKISRAIIKEPKIYFYDSALVFDEGARFENAVAVGLLSAAHYKTDTTGKTVRIGFLKTKEQKEVDFVIVNEKNEPVHLVETKLADANVSKQLIYFSEKYSIPATQVVYTLKTNFVHTTTGVNVVDGITFLSALSV